MAGRARSRRRVHNKNNHAQQLVILPSMFITPVVLQRYPCRSFGFESIHVDSLLFVLAQVGEFTHLLHSNNTLLPSWVETSIPRHVYPGWPLNSATRALCFDEDNNEAHTFSAT